MKVMMSHQRTNPISMHVNWILAILSSNVPGSEKSHLLQLSLSAGCRNPKNCLNEMLIIALMIANCGQIIEKSHFSGEATDLVLGISYSTNTTIGPRNARMNM